MNDADAASALSYTILVIEDDLKIRQLLIDGLSSQGYMVLEADNGLEGLKVLEQTLPDLCILDLNMPKLDGLAFLQAFLKNRNETAKVPSIVLTAQSSDEEINKAMGLGAKHFLVKPIRFKLLLSYVRSCLEEAK